MADSVSLLAPEERASTSTTPQRPNLRQRRERSFAPGPFPQTACALSTPITSSQLRRNNYQSRWTIEEFFKALKTGCGYEKRQLESYAALSNALAIFSVIAWRLLLVRSVARAYPHATSRSVLSDTQLRLLKHRLKLTNLPATAKDALYAVARLGGHLKNNGDPGWQTLGRGFEKLLILEAGWRAATDANLA